MGRGPRGSSSMGQDSSSVGLVLSNSGPKYWLTPSFVDLSLCVCVCVHVCQQSTSGSKDMSCSVDRHTHCSCQSY